MPQREKNTGIETLLCPNHSELIIEDGISSAKILDAELDIIDCVFNGDGCVEIDTENLTYIVLTQENLTTLLKLIKRAK